MDGQRGRIPVPETEALRAYAMFDITIMDHKSKKYAGKGFFLSNGVLRGFEGLVFHTRTADDRRTTTMVEGPACSNRQPSGWIGQMIRSLRVLMHHLDKNVDGDMQELWAVCPALRNRSMDAVIVYQGGTHFGFVKKEQISLFKSTYGKDAVGTLARSVDSRTGAYNLYSAQVMINAA